MADALPTRLYSSGDNVMGSNTGGKKIKGHVITKSMNMTLGKVIDATHEKGLFCNDIGARSMMALINLDLINFNKRDNRYVLSTPRGRHTYRRSTRKSPTYLTDHDVELMKALEKESLSYEEIADKFDIHKRTARKKCCGK